MIIDAMKSHDISHKLFYISYRTATIEERNFYFYMRRPSLCLKRRSSAFSQCFRARQCYCRKHIRKEEKPINHFHYQFYVWSRAGDDVVYITNRNKSDNRCDVVTVPVLLYLAHTILWLRIGQWPQLYFIYRIQTQKSSQHLSQT